VAGNQVPVQAVAQPQGMLQVDLAGTVQAAGEKEFRPPSQGETQGWVLTLDRE